MTSLAKPPSPVPRLQRCSSPASIISPPCRPTRPAMCSFYTKALGLRLVKKTVNQDDVSAYHLFYADGLASPGSDITFFDFPAAPEQRGNNTITRTGLRVTGEASLAWWHERLKQVGGQGRRDRRARRPPDARFRGSGRPAAGAGRRWRQRRGQRLGEEPGAGRASDPRPRADRHDGAGPAADRSGAHPCHEHEAAARLSRTRNRTTTACMSTA